MPGINEMRMPWPSSTKSNPSSPLISRNIWSPAVWRPEFQQVENAITLDSRSDWRRRCFCCRNFAHGGFAALPADASQNQQRDRTIRNSSNCQCGRHSDEIGKAGHTESSDWHESNKAQHEDSRDPSAQIIWRTFLHNRAGETEIRSQAK